MHDHEVARLINLLAIATPIAAMVFYPALRARMQDWNRARIRLLILGLAGPANWLAWHLFNGWIDVSGYRSVLGFALAALVFFSVGAGLGMFRRRRILPESTISTSGHAEEQDPAQTDQNAAESSDSEDPAESSTDHTRQSGPS